MGQTNSGCIIEGGLLTQVQTHAMERLWGPLTWLYCRDTTIDKFHCISCLAKQLIVIKLTCCSTIIIQPQIKIFQLPCDDSIASSPLLRSGFFVTQNGPLRLKQ